jgi:hypothetical protein
VKGEGRGARGEGRHRMLSIAPVEGDGREELLALQAAEAHPLGGAVHEVGQGACVRVELTRDGVAGVDLQGWAKGLTEDANRGGHGGATRGRQALLSKRGDAWRCV